MQIRWLPALLRYDYANHIVGAPSHAPLSCLNSSRVAQKSWLLSSPPAALARDLLLVTAGLQVQVRPLTGHLAARFTSASSLV